MASLPSIRITSEFYSLAATLDDKDNPSFKALLSENWSDSRETGGELVSDGSGGVYSTHMCSIIKFNNQNANIK